MDEFNPLNLFGGNDDDKKEDVASAAESTIDASPGEESPEIEPENVAEDEEESAEKGDETNPDEGAVTDSANDEMTDTEEVAPDSQTEPSFDKLDLVLGFQEKALERLEALEALFNERIKHTDYEDKIIERMHNELQKYRDDMYSQLVRPILLDVIEVRDSIMRIAAFYLEKPEGEQSIPNKTFADYAYDLKDILESNSVEIYRSEPGGDYTPIKQRIIKKTATDDKSLHGKVEKSLSCGYSYNGRVISAEKVAVYFYEKPENNNEKSEVTENG